MSAMLIDRQENTLTIQLRIPLTRSLFETEQTILQTLNQAGTLATTEALKQFDTDGSPIQIGQSRYTTKGQEPKTYQTPYGEALVERHVYQTAQGGPTFCPLERDARIEKPASLGEAHPRDPRREHQRIEEARRQQRHHHMVFLT